MMDAKELVITTLVTDGADFLMALRMPVVPIIAGSKRSCFVFSGVVLKWNCGELASCYY